jgi:hypothetical protein
MAFRARMALAPESGCQALHPVRRTDAGIVPLICQASSLTGLRRPEASDPIVSGRAANRAMRRGSLRHRCVNSLRLRRW